MHQRFDGQAKSLTLQLRPDHQTIFRQIETFLSSDGTNMSSKSGGVFFGTDNWNQIIGYQRHISGINARIILRSAGA